MDNILTQMKEKEKSKELWSTSDIYIQVTWKQNALLFSEREETSKRAGERGRIVDKKGEYKEHIMSYMNENNNKTH